jgi:hypothetical protein
LFGYKCEEYGRVNVSLVFAHSGTGKSGIMMGIAEALSYQEKDGVEGNPT